jgi:hypothetical protein
MQTIELDNGQKINVVQTTANYYVLVDIPRYSYYVGIGESD